LSTFPISRYIPRTRVQEHGTDYQNRDRHEANSRLS
jgi:hypothetical protein